MSPQRNFISGWQSDRDITNKIDYIDRILQVRRTGRTTKLANFFIQQLFVMGEAFPIDHYPTIDAHVYLVRKIKNLIEDQYPLLLGCVIVTERTSVILDKVRYLANVERHLSTVIPPDDNTDNHNTQD